MRSLEYSEVDLVNGTSFHGVTIKTSINKLTEVLGEPVSQDNNGTDKVNVEWDVITEDKVVGTIYDWKEYRKLKENEEIEFHLGSKNPIDSVYGKDELLKLLNK